MEQPRALAGAALLPGLAWPQASCLAAPAPASPAGPSCTRAQLRPVRGMNPGSQECTQCCCTFRPAPCKMLCRCCPGRAPAICARWWRTASCAGKSLPCHAPEGCRRERQGLGGSAKGRGTREPVLPRLGGECQLQRLEGGAPWGHAAKDAWRVRPAHGQPWEPAIWCGWLHQACARGLLCSPSMVPRTAALHGGQPSSHAVTLASSSCPLHHQQQLAGAATAAPGAGWRASAQARPGRAARHSAGGSAEGRPAAAGGG